ncbi:tetratricopeptide repeat protein [Reichenbachiella ulvae]|uniref:Tetratricopeptide repeat protein n=1 Tax=Reichenbachiella ulvae TaxID=2980104 RepID=A0ABT3CR48_9BACT|nr:tetratricopeptide repeat protein [Reichenbachiella ulvae]MCV9386170.1 tetratricopeptide repeat protein [Reichenbachiella ulvae]
MNYPPHLMIRSLLVLMVVLISIQSHAQDLDVDARFRHAKLLYQKGAYVAARGEFESIKAKRYLIESEFFVASSAVRAGQDDGEYLIQKFVDTYPYHHYAKGAYADLGNYYFDRGNYSEALKNYEKSQDDYNPELYFKRGYCHFSIGNYQKAKVSFSKLEGTFTSYEKDAAYFQGYMRYNDGQVEEALPYLESGFESEDFGVAAFELYVSGLYSMKRYKQLIQLIEDKPEKKSQSLLNFYADAFYVLGKYKKAAEEYEGLFQNYHRSRNEVNYYKAGYSNYKLGNKTVAEEQLKRSAVADDTVGAYASYYLGVLYHEDGNLPFAVTSFENTTKYDTRLKEDAYYQLAKALMEVPNYERAIEVISEYLEVYPDAVYKSATGEMISMAYALTDNYDLALQYIESRSVLTNQMKRTYQRVSFLKGMALYNDKKFDQALKVFQKSLIHDMDSDVTQNAYYWAGECLALLGREEESLFYYRSVINDGSDLYLKAIYSKAYALFNIQEYAEAQLAFQDFEKKYNSAVNKKYLGDAYLRMGDCSFALKKYSQSITYYKKAESAGNKKLGEIYYQIGLMYRYLDNPSDAKTYFNKIIKDVPNSDRMDNAYYQLAKIEFEKGEAAKAIDLYRSFSNKFPNSEIVPFALLDQAVAYDNIGQAEACVNNYKQILDRFPRHETAKSALLGLQQKSNQSKFDNFQQYLARYKSANPNSEALENIEFETAQGHYYNQKYQVAIQSLQEFIKDYPNSSLIVTARYLIADSYYRMDDSEAALKSFYAIEREKDFSRHTKVLHRIASLEAEKGNVVISNQYYHMMKSSTTSAKNIIFAETGLMENFSQMEDYDSAIYYGQSLLSNARAGVLVEASANLIVGKALFEQEKFEEALVHLLPLVGNSPDERGAEAYLFISKIYYQKKQYEKALESLFSLTNNFKNYEYWQSEAFLLMADIYIETDEIFQAKATLNSLIEHASMEEIKFRAQSKLDQIAEQNEVSN